MGEKLERLQAFANALQGYYNVTTESVPSQDQAANIAAEARKLDLKDAQLLPGWEVVHLPAIQRGQVDETVEGGLGAPAFKPPLWMVRGPMHRRHDVPWAGGPGFSGSRDQVLRFLSEIWLADFARRLAAIHAAAVAEKEKTT